MLEGSPDKEQQLRKQLATLQERLGWGHWAEYTTKWNALRFPTKFACL